nr:MAG TPA: hypothetical protein [Bacteriophage sp.]
MFLFCQYQSNLVESCRILQKGYVCEKIDRFSRKK